ncbi:MAG TPA: SpoIIE family protein phosphatase [Candidatus Angelobacter sp.]|jgi:sigma-B regulation protein RsbU (phosphoserine phosphatase)|nr:SpoIIE family protein phosphatase [Candidatus Angelobacter sp.]
MKFFLPFNSAAMRERRHKRRKSPQVISVETVLLIELLCAVLLLAFTLTGRRGAFLDHIHPRADAMFVVLLACAVAASHFIFVRRVLPVLRRRASPIEYDHQRILLELGDAARHSNNLADVYKFSVNTVAHALDVAQVSFLVCDQETGNFITRSTSAGQSSDDPAAPPLVLTHDAFVVRRLSKLSAPLRIETEDLDAWQRAAGFIQGINNSKREAERNVLKQLDSRLLVQIRNKAQLTGILSLGPRHSGFDFGDKDLKMLMSIGEQLALVIDNSNLVERIVDQEKMLHEMALAASVQKHLFPVDAPQSPMIQIGGYCKPAGYVGGDYYDFMQLENGRIGMAVADVAGKGFAAALLTFMIHAFLRSQALSAGNGSALRGSLTQLATSLNRLLFASTSSASYVTLFYAAYEESSGRLSFVNAGHNPPFVLHAHPTTGEISAQAHTNGVMKLESGGPMLGLFQDCPIQESSFLLRSGDFLFAYTDGAIDAVNPAGEEFGEDRLLTLVKSKSHLPALKARDEIFRGIEEWCGDAAQPDDITMVVLKVNEAA